MVDYRYNLKPEVFIPDESELYGGFQTHWDGDGSFQGGFRFGINDLFEMGSRVYFSTEEQVAKRFILIDLGLKFALNQSSALQADALLGINNSEGGAVMIGYTNSQAYTSRFSALYETRLGFFDAVTHGNWMIIQTGAYSQFKIASPLSLRIGLLAFTDLRKPLQQFEISLLPGALIGVSTNLQVLAECGVDIIGSKGLRLSINAIGRF